MQPLDPMKALSDTGFPQGSFVSSEDMNKIKQAMVNFARNYNLAFIDWYTHGKVSTSEADQICFETTHYKSLTPKEENQ